jgi:DNA-directed RNA polymerase specialized sigma24 family protein
VTRHTLSGCAGLIERREAGDFVRACIQELPESHRTVLILRDLDKRTGEETARILGLTGSVVKARLRRARRALRSLLEPRFPRHADGPTEPAERTPA